MFLYIFVLFHSSIAHTVHESVTEQASILVNGKLKEYQIKVSIHIWEPSVSLFQINLMVTETVFGVVIGRH